MKNRIILALILLASFSFNSCTKQGATGLQGPTGAAGSPGANLFSYQSNGNIPISNNGFKGSAPLYSYTISLPTLDKSSSSLIEVFFSIAPTSVTKTVANTPYTPMPAQNVFVSQDELYFTYGDNVVTIYYGGAGVSAPPPVQINYWIDIVQP